MKGEHRIYNPRIARTSGEALFLRFLRHRVHSRSSLIAESKSCGISSRSFAEKLVITGWLSWKYGYYGAGQINVQSPKQRNNE